MSDGVLVAERVSIKRGGRTIISAFSLEAGAGEVVGVVGKNGTGKSTLLMAIAGVLEPRDGRITIDGASVWGSSAQRARCSATSRRTPTRRDFCARTSCGRCAPRAARPRRRLTSSWPRLASTSWASFSSNACRSASAGGRVWLPRCSGRRVCSCSTSRTTGSMRGASKRSSRSFARTLLRATPRSSRRTTARSSRGWARES